MQCWPHYGRTELAVCCLKTKYLPYSYYLIIAMLEQCSYVPVPVDRTQRTIRLRVNNKDHRATQTTFSHLEIYGSRPTQRCMYGVHLYKYKKIHFNWRTNRKREKMRALHTLVKTNNIFFTVLIFIRLLSGIASISQSGCILHLDDIYLVQRV